MVTSCCVPKCGNNSITSNATGKISFHRFTRNPKLLPLWINAVTDNTGRGYKARPFRPSIHTKICSAHFLEDDFQIINGNKQKRSLKADVVPSIFAWTEKERLQENLMIADIKPKEEIMEIDEGPSILEDVEYKPVLEDGIAIAPIPTTSKHMMTNTVQNDIKISTNEEAASSGRLSYSELLTLYTDLVIEHSQCKKPGKTMNVATNTTNFLICPCSKNSPQRSIFSIDKFKHSDSAIQYYTGFPNYHSFDSTFKMFLNFKPTTIEKKSHQHFLSPENEYFLTLLKLRQNLTYHLISLLFDVSVSSVGNIFNYWINHLYTSLNSLDNWPHRDILLSQLHGNIKTRYFNVISSIDSVEIFIQTPSIRQSSAQKDDNVLKGLIAIAPTGRVIFTSQLSTDSLSDKKLLEKSGFLSTVEGKLNNKFLLPEDKFVVHKDFIATEILKNVDLCIPKFEFLPGDTVHTQTIPLDRVPVEKAIRRIKTYKILTSTVPITMIGSISKIWTVCCLLSNYHMPQLLSEENDEKVDDDDNDEKVDDDDDDD